MINVEGLYHSYTNNDQYAINNVSFTVPKGEIFGFLGAFGRREINHAGYPYRFVEATTGARIGRGI